MVKATAATLRADGYTVYVENDNFFKLSNNNGITLSGKPDLVAVRPGHTIVIDCKTGQSRDSDQQQVLIYMRLLPLCFPEYKNLEITGRVQYRDEKVDLGPDKLDTQFHTNLRQIMERVTGSAAPVRMPSLQECSYCNITKIDCPDRIEPSPVAHDLF
jgi:hypothetical protein